MSSPSLTGYSPNNPRRYLGPNITVPILVVRNREPTGADIKQPDTGRYYSFGTFWLIGESAPNTPPVSGIRGDLWYLSKIAGNVAFWLQLSSGGSGNIIEILVNAITAPGVNPVTSNLGQIVFNGLAVAAHSIPIETRSRALHAMNVEVQESSAVLSSDPTQSGISHFNSTQFNVDANGFVSLNPIIDQSSSNLGITYSSGIFTVCGDNGTALSASNPAIIWLQDSVNPGLLKQYTITANQTFTDGAGGDTATMRWGLTAGINASVDIPFYLYAVGNDAQNSISFMISRIPHAIIAPIASSIGQNAAVVNVGQGDFFSLATITTSLYASNPCLVLGSFRMQFTGATNSWTVQTLTTQDGIGEFKEQVTFTFPPGQFGAASGNVFLNNGGTAPVMAGFSYTYQMSKSGMVYFDLAGNVSVDGVGAVTLLGASPLKKGNIGFVTGSGFWVAAGGSPGSTMILGGFAANSSVFNTIINTYVGGIGIVTANLLNTDLTATATYQVKASFQAST